MDQKPPGLMTGYFIGSFFRFLFLLVLATPLQAIFVYIFGANLFTISILSIVFSFFINTSLYIKDSYPFFRHILINSCVYYIQINWISLAVERVYDFYEPSTLWVIFICSSFVIGIISSFGKFGHGFKSKDIEMYANAVLFLIVIAGFFFFWWEGAVMFIVFRVLLVNLENWIAKLFLYGITKKYDGIQENEEHTININ